MAERHRLLRLALLGPAHLGSAWGEAALDRPTQVDAWRGLPFVPASALKGVMAGRHGDVPDGDVPDGDGPDGDDPNGVPAANPLRERRYGSPDREDAPGVASRVVVGDARPLAFPLAARDGGRVWIFPAETLAWALGMEGLGAGEAAGAETAGSAQAARQLARLERASEGEDALAPEGHRLPALVGGGVRGLLANVQGEQRRALFAAASRLSGPAVPAAEPRLVVSSRRAGELWHRAAERRHLTALEGGRKTVRHGTLRSVELVPEGTVLLSLVTLLQHGDDGAEPETDLEPDLGRIQVGAWEGLGFGWGELSWVPAIEVSAPEVSGTEKAEAAPPAGKKAPGDAAGSDGEQAPDLARIMGQAFEAVEALAEQGPRVRAVGRTAIRKFGWRFARQGAEAALAFELARARPFEARPKPEMWARRWLLTALLELPDRPGGIYRPEAAFAPGPSEPLRRWLRGSPFEAPLTEAWRETVLLRLGWLRRYAEVALAAEVDESPEPAEPRPAEPEPAETREEAS